MQKVFTRAVIRIANSALCVRRRGHVGNANSVYTNRTSFPPYTICVLRNETRRAFETKNVIKRYTTTYMYIKFPRLYYSVVIINSEVGKITPRLLFSYLIHSALCSTTHPPPHTVAVLVFLTNVSNKTNTVVRDNLTVSSWQLAQRLARRLGLMYFTTFSASSSSN